MVKKIACLLLTFLASLLLVANPVKADHQTSFSDMEKIMIDLLNVTRVNPSQAAEAFGVDPVLVFSGIPDHSPFWDARKWFMQSSDSLKVASSAHALDMLARNYYGHVSPEGEGPEQRARKSGYRPKAIYEEMAMIAFQNYISPESAGLEIFKSFFLDQVHSFREGKANIFDHGIKDIGLTFEFGKMYLGDKKWNVYLFVVHFGISYENHVEESLIRMINTARSDYSRTLDHFEIDKAEAGKELFDYAFIYIFDGLAPYVFYPSSIGWFENDKNDSLETRIDTNSLTWNVLVSNDACAWSVGQALFKEMIFLDNYIGLKALLDARANAASIKVQLVMVNENVMLAEATFSIDSKDQQTIYLTGNLLSDNEFIDFLSQGNGLENIHLALYDAEGKLLSATKTGPLGSYRLSQKQGQNTWKIFYKDSVFQEGSITADHRSKWKDIFVAYPLTFLQ